MKTKHMREYIYWELFPNSKCELHKLVYVQYGLELAHKLSKNGKVYALASSPTNDKLFIIIKHNDVMLHKEIPYIKGDLRANLKKTVDRIT